MNELQIFQNEQFGTIRTAGTAEEPLFCAADVAKSLGYANPAKAVIDHCKGVTILETPTAGGVQSIKFISESEVYRLIFNSNAPKAEEFTEWVTSEVLPSIRKHGVYATGETIEKILADPDNAIIIMQTLQKERKERLAAQAEVERLEQKTIEDKPKVVFADAIVGSKTSCLIGELANLLTQNGFEIGQNRLFAWMRNNHYLGTVGEFYNIPCQKYLEMGLFELKKNVHSQNGQMVTTITPKVTGKGQQYFINKFLSL